MGIMHLAIGQAPIILGDISKNLEIMEALIKESKKKHDEEIALIVFPESVSYKHMTLPTIYSV